MRGSVIAGLSVAACFSPQPPRGAPCPDNRVCPDGLTCIGGLCVAPVPVDAATGAEPDGSPDVDSDGDGVDDASDNCRFLANADQRDWDADARGDACDGCPHLASPSDPDGDGDGVGDACDPRPVTGGDVRVRWNGFYDASEIADWEVGAGVWSVSNGALAQTDSGYGLLAAPGTDSRIYLATSFEIVERIADAAVGECNGVTQDSDCCSIADFGMLVAQTQSSSDTSTVPWSGTFAAGSRIDFVQTIDAVHMCRFTQGTSAVMDEIPAAVVPGPIMFATLGVSTRVRYLFVVRIGS